MKNLFDLQPMLDAIEKDGVFAVDEQENLIQITASTKPSSIKKFADAETIKKEMLKKMFGNTNINAENYRLMVRLFKTVYEETNSMMKSKINKEVNIKINPKPKSIK